MKKLILIALLFVNFQAYCQTDGFKGNWGINKSKTDFGDLPEYVLPTTIKVDENTNAISIYRKIPFNDTVSEATMMLGFDGATKDIVTSAGVKVKGQLKSHSKDTLTVYFQTFNADGTLQTSVTEVWSLTDGGKALTIDRNIEQSDGNKYDIIGYYDKQ